MSDNNIIREIPFGAPGPTSASVSQTPTPTPTITPTITPTPTKTPLPSPTPNPNKGFYNECEPITIFDMGIACVAIQPSKQTSSDGALSLEITGGTPPYTITWSNGNQSPAIGNLKSGSYDVTVVDYYGDFTAKTTCVLSGQTIQPTPTPTPTPSSIPTGPTFCLSANVAVSPRYIELMGSSPFVNINETFSVDSFVNGKISWISDSNNYRIYWEPTPPPGAWTLSSATPIYIVIINNNPNTVLNETDWQVLGGTTTFDVFEGSCSSPKLISPFTIVDPNIELFVVQNQTICGCEGAIMANATGGNLPYQYSIDGGITYKNFPIFDNLCGGNYTVTVKDSSGYTKSTQITINEPQQPTTYFVKLNKTSSVLVDNGTTLTRSYQCELSVVPPLPNTSTITYDVIHTNNFQSSITSSSSTLNTNTILTLNDTPITLSNTNTTTGTTINIIDGCQDKLVYLTGTSEVWEGLTYSNGDSLIINTTTSVTKNFTSGCDIGLSEDIFYLSNLKINGCNCCSVQNVTI